MLTWISVKKPNTNLDFLSKIIFLKKSEKMIGSSSERPCQLHHFFWGPLEFRKERKLMDQMEERVLRDETASSSPHWPQIDELNDY